MITPVVSSVLFIISGKDCLPHGSSYTSLELAGPRKIMISCITALVFVHPEITVYKNNSTEANRPEELVP